MRANRIRLHSYSTFDQPPQRHRHRVNGCSHPTTKSVVFILIWILVIGFIKNEFYSSYYFAIKPFGSTEPKIALFIIAAVFHYVIIATSLMFYPLGGFLADIYLGRYRTVIGSLVLLTVSILMALGLITFTVQLDVNASSSSLLKIVEIVGGVFAGFILILGLAGFISNVFQFGLDQLQDAPSRKLGMFIHVLVWVERIGEVLFHLTYVSKNYIPLISDMNQSKIDAIILYFTPALLFAMLGVLLILNCFTHKMFNKERVKYNPYKMILKVLNFARKHKRPVGHPSAFAYCDTFKPSRMDYAKERYGGPFTTSDVEDVKTFTRVFLMLIALGPTFIIVVPTSFNLFSTFAMHTGPGGSITEFGEGLLLHRGVLSHLATVIIFPVYTWLMFSILSKQNMLPRILYRIMFATVLNIVTVILMFVVDLTGHVMMTSTSNETETCMLYSDDFNSTSHIQHLNLHWSVLILPNLTKTLALDLIMASTFEFISAQSPHTMKGVLVGLLFAVRGFFQLIEAVLLFPFSVESIWEKLQLNPHFSCGTTYYLITIVIGFLGVIMFAIAARKYQYRKREEEPYSQSRVEEIYDRMLREREQRQVSRINTLQDINTDA